MFDNLWLVPVLAETTEEEDDWVLERKKSKMKMRQRLDRDEVMAVHDMQEEWAACRSENMQEMNQ